MHDARPCGGAFCRIRAARLAKARRVSSTGLTLASSPGMQGAVAPPVAAARPDDAAPAAVEDGGAPVTRNAVTAAAGVVATFVSDAAAQPSLHVPAAGVAPVGAPAGEAAATTAGPAALAGGALEVTRVPRVHTPAAGVDAAAEPLVLPTAATVSPSLRSARVRRASLTERPVSDSFVQLSVMATPRSSQRGSGSDSSDSDPEDFVRSYSQAARLRRSRVGSAGSPVDAATSPQGALMRTSSARVISGKAAGGAEAQPRRRPSSLRVQKRNTPYEARRRSTSMNALAMGDAADQSMIAAAAAAVASVAAIRGSVDGRDLVQRPMSPLLLAAGADAGVGRVAGCPDGAVVPASTAAVVGGASAPTHGGHRASMLSMGLPLRRGGVRVKSVNTLGGGGGSGTESDGAVSSVPRSIAMLERVLQALLLVHVGAGDVVCRGQHSGRDAWVLLAGSVRVGAGEDAVAGTPSQSSAESVRCGCFACACVC